MSSATSTHSFDRSSSAAGAPANVEGAVPREMPALIRNLQANNSAAVSNTVATTVPVPAAALSVGETPVRAPASRVSPANSNQGTDPVPQPFATASSASPAAAVPKKKKGPAKKKTPVSGASDQTASPAKTRTRWDNDRGGAGRLTSIEVLVLWLSDAGNYARWKGAGGTTIKQCGDEVAAKIAAAGCTAPRSQSAVVEKIRELYAQFAAAEAWLNETGQGQLDAAAEIGGIDGEHYQDVHQETS
ncbi:hypothetical protein CF319_g7409 [Tilletia indica]|nr:hypothetical protein CF319_g7409 [Tilletia indica]